MIRSLCISFIANLLIANFAFSQSEIELIIPFREGGGSDAWARFIAPHLSNQLENSPTIDVRNIPGGGSTKAANQYAANPVLDGSQLFGTSASTQFPFLLGDSRVRYDYEDWEVLLVYPTGGIVYISPDFGVSNAGELIHIMDQRLTYGSQGTTSLDLVPLLGFELLGLNVRPIFGVRGRDAGRVAFERGDATIDFQTTAAYLSKVQKMAQAGEAIPLFTLGAFDSNGELVRDSAFPHLPNIAEVFEMLHGVKPSGLAWESWFGFFSAGFGAQKILVIPKSTPLPIINSYKQAVDSMLQDPSYLRSKDEVLGGYDIVGGAAAQTLYRLATEIPDEQRRWVREWLAREFGVVL